MKILGIINDLKREYENNTTIRKNNTLLLGAGKIPKARHMLFEGLEQELIDKYLKSNYANKFPEEYIVFLKKYNGANLFNVKIMKNDLEFASGMFTIYGLPRTPPFNRPNDMEEPYDLRVEDLARHSSLPNTWLKCGHYKRTEAFGDRTDLFIDTLTGRVYCCKKNECKILEEWKSLDECLCNIFETMSARKTEYQY